MKMFYINNTFQKCVHGSLDFLKYFGIFKSMNKDSQELQNPSELVAKASWERLAGGLWMPRWVRVYRVLRPWRSWGYIAKLSALIDAL